MRFLMFCLLLGLAACGKGPTSGSAVTGKSSFSVWTKSTGGETLTFTGKTIGSVTMWDVDPAGCYYQETIAGQPNNFTVTILAHHGSGCGTFAVWNFINDGAVLTRCYNSLTTHLDVCETFN